MTQSISLPNPLLDLLCSKLDANRIEKGKLSDEVFNREINAVVDHLLNLFPHWNQAQKREQKEQTMAHIRSADRQQLCATVRELARTSGPLPRRIIFAIIFCLFGLIIIVATLFNWLFDFLTPRCESTAIHESESRFETVRDLSHRLSQRYWPDKPLGCYCCETAVE